MDFQSLTPELQRDYNKYLEGTASDRGVLDYARDEGIEIGRDEGIEIGRN